MTETIGGYHKWQAFYFPTNLHSLLTEALCLGKIDTTMALHLLFMFGVVTFRTVYICRNAKTRLCPFLSLPAHSRPFCPRRTTPTRAAPVGAF